NALRVARQLVEHGHAQNVALDVTTFTVTRRADGSLRVFDAMFVQPSAYPESDRASGIAVSPRATRALTDRPGAVTPKTLLVGRDDVLRALVDGASQAIASRVPSLATILAEPGFGKSALCSALIERLALHSEARILSIRGATEIASAGF